MSKYTNDTTAKDLIRKYRSTKIDKDEFDDQFVTMIKEGEISPWELLQIAHEYIELLAETQS